MLIMNRVFRNKIVIEHLIAEGVIKNQRDLGIKMGYTNESAFSQVINEKVATPKDFTSKLKIIMPNLNEEWLINGTGSMIIGRVATMTPFESSEPIPNQQQALEQVMSGDHNVVFTDADSIGLKEYPVELVEEIKEEVREEIREEVIAEITKAESVPFVPSRIANNVQVEDIREYLEKKGDELERIKPGDLVGNPDSAERIRKTSMSPTFIPGDIVFVQFLDNIRNITDGQIYYFKMATRPTMIRRVKIEGDDLRLVADNPNFGDIITSFDEIVNVADIVGMFRSSFGNQYAEVEAVRAKKEQQIDNLIEEIRDAGKRTDVLMSQNLELMKKLLEK